MKTDGKKRHFRPLFLLLVLAVLCPTRIYAALPQPDLTAPCALHFEIKDHNGNGIPGGSVFIYRVAQWDASCEPYCWKLTEAFASCRLAAENPESHENAAVLSAYAFRTAAEAKQTQIDQQGRASYEGLSAGLYLVVQNQPAAGYKAFEPFLLALPLYDQTQAQYATCVTASPKMEPIYPPIPVPVVITGTKPLPNPPVPRIPPLRNDDNLPANAGKDILPRTGQLRWPVPFLLLCGAGLLIIGRRLRKKSGGQDE